ncbi:hypothetical protein KORDIASMS9_00945 [Kordia sp. SMS9]|uniref:hypothetical protein n=1 Tax=Kordia sp. SMS9 TaxID=2282170 RepID=UPI000E0DC947|nr:hypothetical protein [Kordia sp. SMS9]AXG68729.1 hypothetical protein KORDIASMS9_00945 [Kordia sp. SMS9]
MRKSLSYIILGIAIIAFIYTFIRTGEIGTSFLIAGIGLAWFLFENIFELITLFGPKSNKKSNDEIHRKAKEALKKVTDNNPTLR